MRFMQSILKWNECGKSSSYEEVEIVTRNGKKYWVCPNCDFETPIVDEVFSPRKRKALDYYSSLCSPIFLFQILASENVSNLILYRLEN